MKHLTAVCGLCSPQQPRVGSHRLLIATAKMMVLLAVGMNRSYASSWISDSSWTNDPFDFIRSTNQTLSSTQRSEKQADSAAGCSQDSYWNEYVAPDRDFDISYPNTASPRVLQEKIAGLLSRTSFPFSQPFDAGKGNRGTIAFDVQVSIWLNPHTLTAEQWAKRDSDPALTSDAGPRTVSGLKGFGLRKSDLASWSFEIYVARADRMYEITYLDIAKDNDLINTATADCWKSVLDKMTNSFKLI